MQLEENNQKQDGVAMMLIVGYKLFYSVHITTLRQPQFLYINEKQSWFLFVYSCLLSWNVRKTIKFLLSLML